MLKPLLIEVGVEELPAIPFLKELPNIEKKWSKVLEKNHLLCEFDFYYTPRRMVFWHREFPTKQPDSTEEFFGAPLSIAYKDGKPTPAAISFAKKCDIDIELLQSTTKNNKKVLYYNKSKIGKKSNKLIGEMLHSFLKSLNFGKSMRWGSLEESFIRPIRWIAVMLGDEKVPFKMYGVESDIFSYPHRSISYKPFSFDFSGEYFCKLDKNGVVLYQEERKKSILKQFEKLENENNIQIETDKDLLDEIVTITEKPTALLGRFDESFLKLPSEVIITSMKEHQRYFPVFKNSTLSNYFVVVSNAITDDFSLIIKGNEKVLRARLSDALFFYNNDLKNGLSEEGLKDVVYIQGLGSIYDKEIRESYIARYLLSKYRERFANADIQEVWKLLERAVMLSKADLLSEIVYEFTELQGIMGYYYAKAMKEDKKICMALKEQYLPNSETSSVPESIFSSIVALSSKLDTIFALFNIGKTPTGNKDPFALRRAANGVLKIVLDKSLEFDISQIVDDLSKNYPDIDRNRVEEFFLERLYQFFKINPSVVKAVLQSGERDVCTIYEKVTAFEKIVSSDDFKDIFTTFKRVSNIIKDVDTTKELFVDKSMFKQEEEKGLFEKYIQIRDKNFENFEERLGDLFSLKPNIDKFFDNVMVNVEDINIKTNRKNLIASIYKTFKEIADIKEISI